MVQPKIYRPAEKVLLGQEAKAIHFFKAGKKKPGKAGFTGLRDRWSQSDGMARS